MQIQIFGKDRWVSYGNTIKKTGDLLCKFDKKESENLLR